MVRVNLYKSTKFRLDQHNNGVIEFVKLWLEYAYGFSNPFSRSKYALFRWPSHSCGRGNWIWDDYLFRPEFTILSHSPSFLTTESAFLPKIHAKTMPEDVFYIYIPSSSSQPSAFRQRSYLKVCFWVIFKSL